MRFIIAGLAAILLGSVVHLLINGVHESGRTTGAAEIHDLEGDLFRLQQRVGNSPIVLKTENLTARSTQSEVRFRLQLTARNPMRPNSWTREKCPQLHEFWRGLYTAASAQFLDESTLEGVAQVFGASPQHLVRQRGIEWREVWDVYAPNLTDFLYGCGRLVLPTPDARGSVELTCSHKLTRDQCAERVPPRGFLDRLK